MYAAGVVVAHVEMPQRPQRRVPARVRVATKRTISADRSAKPGRGSHSLRGFGGGGERFPGQSPCPAVIVTPYSRSATSRPVTVNGSVIFGPSASNDEQDREWASVDRIQV